MQKSAKRFVFCVHAHQPVGNFDAVVADAYESCYRPFFETIERHPRVPVACHFSGSLIDWLEENRPEFIAHLKRLAARGQLEFLGGGYYEPIFGAIPPRDLAGQILMMQEKVRRLYGVSPEGAWLTERVWDPALVKALHAAGVRYTVLDDAHFEHTGITDPSGFYRAEDAGSGVSLFASMKELRYLMPFREPEATLEYLHAFGGDATDAVVFADDLEKFGLWPGTRQWVYGERWLDKFLTLLADDPRVETVTFARALKEGTPNRTVTIPHASYSEMMEWSGGRFYHFFEKYDESRYMKDRMWHLSGKIGAQEAVNGSAAKVADARRFLYKAQCNCAYWHGVFGGLYLHHLRSAIFENLIRADAALDEARHDGRDEPQVEKIPLASVPYWRVKQKELVSFFNPAYGGSLEELDHLPSSANLLCSLQRRPEPYHRLVAGAVQTASAEAPFSIHSLLGTKDKDLEKHLHYDPSRRLSLMDRFFETEIGLEDFRRASYEECGDFVGAVYETRAVGQSLQFKRSGTVSLAGEKSRVTLEKVVEPSGSHALSVRYAIVNESGKELSFGLGIEFNFSIGDAAAMAGIRRDAVRICAFHDAWRGLLLRLSTDEATDFLAVPVETVSESEGGLETTYQGLGVLMQRTLYLAPGGRAVFGLGLSVESV